VGVVVAVVPQAQVVLVLLAGQQLSALVVILPLLVVRVD
jgi:hypothetical protein